YDIHFSDTQDFLLLTGANMSGKTTFMRAIGVSALLAHLGMGVPAKSLSISFLQGIITSMQVEDDLMRGESYFFAEVQRMKLTAQQLLKPEAHLVLMDELFKGTNVHDAYECTRAVVEGLLHRPNHLMILSTHLYEVAQHFKERKEIQFAYFVTKMQQDGSYHFTYELRKGISDDRIGYRILQKEGVLDLLRRQGEEGIGK
ncbi:MAG: DNA mismatch repair protein MutS, partial [Bacteroidetes bacterium]|nr:DNA mismatch repair protein MutS [Bacteroidota bacterium]